MEEFRRFLIDHQEVKFSCDNLKLLERFNDLHFSGFLWMLWMLIVTG